MVIGCVQMSACLLFTTVGFLHNHESKKRTKEKQLDSQDMEDCSAQSGTLWVYNSVNCLRTTINIHTVTVVIKSRRYRYNIFIEIFLITTKCSPTVASWQTLRSYVASQDVRCFSWLITWTLYLITCFLCMHKEYQQINVIGEMRVDVSVGGLGRCNVNWYLFASGVIYMRASFVSDNTVT